MTDKQDIIKKIYFDPVGFDSIKRTFEDARKKDKTITLDDVKQFFKTNVEQKKQLKGYNSFVANEAKFEYQIDLFFISLKDFPNERNIGGVLCIDVFSKFITIIPIKAKTIAVILDAIKQIINKVGKPKNVYTDNEGAWSRGSEINKYFKDENINHIITLAHPNVSERAIRTIKDEIYKRVKLPSDKNWSDLLYPILLKYNFKSVHNSTNLKPSEADKKENEFYAKLNLELNRVRKRRYPDVDVDDNVKIYKKKDKLDKEHISTWSSKIYKVNKIETKFNQKYYYSEGYTQNQRVAPLLRHEILKV